MWYAAGNTSSYEMCARKGLGVLGFSVGTLDELDPVIKSYKKGISQAEPVGAFVNDSILVVSMAAVSEDPKIAEAKVLDPGMAYLVSNTYRYHDTFPHPEHIPYWPERIKTMTPDDLPGAKSAGMVVGDPDQAIDQIRRWEDAGADVLIFPTGWGDHASMLETIRLIGEHVIPKVQTDPVARTTRMREAAAKRLGLV
jgi:alkanesulfonate monooxygenase SsuD/methylene tetrahydromethanopterin reductase-like flavin-dependent oxidoreductase (luciferase family)